MCTLQQEVNPPAVYINYIMYAGKIQEIDYFLGYAVMLKNNPFAWKQTDLERID